ncbi:PIG-L family deacetylase [Propioniciclava sp. MC1683]|uniref:PIG-L deacetylase family protein n=1 Tax=Propioniciclava sp. MC1683 TaxID=2760309 RepID=UPI001602F086|nr:PIG-L family deacetylase [Propioniciclava sp. MC1683]MBB1502096.1 PIG-L family deacetylase [Propioniciclava sp. MC1683]
MTAPAIERLPEDFTRVLCVVAHPDDMEYGASAAVHHWTSRGVEVAYLLLTSGEAGMQSPPEVVGPLRAREQKDACAAVGVDQLTILDHPDGMLEPTLGLRRDIARVIRQFRPDVVVTGSWDVEAPWGLNQADHRAAGLATLDACRDADNTWVFPELATDEGLPKWGPTWLLVHGSDRPTHGVGLAEADVAAAVGSLGAHRAYLADLPEHPKPVEFIPEMLRGQGRALGTAHAVLFRGYRLRG